MAGSESRRLRCERLTACSEGQQTRLEGCTGSGPGSLLNRTLIRLVRELTGLKRAIRWRGARYRPTGALQTALVSLLDRDWRQIANVWRERVLEFDEVAR